MLHLSLSAPLYNSFRVQQVAGLFDVPLEEKIHQTFDVEVPDLTASDWRVGLIVGPSGSGKSTVSRELFGKNLYTSGTWPENAAVVDGFDPALSIREVTALLTSVGFSSPPGWMKPYSVLSNGEKFRCDLARALSQAKLPGKTDSIVAFDEFTSVVDRTVAKVASAALSKGLRSGFIPGRFVAVTCHYDVAQWLEPDWVLNMADRKLTRRCLRRPEIRLEITRSDRSVWPLFARHHYLSGSLAPSARCYLAHWNGTPVAFCGILPLIGYKNRRRISRLVTLPDFQGLGIGMRFAEAVGAMYREAEMRLNITSSHPALIAHCKKSPLWRTINVSGAGSHAGQKGVPGYKGSGNRIVVSFEYIGT